MNVKFLESLVGKSVREAKSEIAQKGLSVEVYRYSDVSTVKAKENTVILFQRDFRVIYVK